MVELATLEKTVSQAYRDPTFEEVARHESRDCTGCEHLLTMWGKFCCVKEKWKGEANMRRCNLWHYRDGHHERKQ